MLPKHVAEGVEISEHDGAEAEALWKDATEGYPPTEPMPLGPPVRDPVLEEMIQTDYELDENDIETIMGKLSD